MLTYVQTGTYACGLYAVAYATALAHGLNPVEAHFEQRKMRRHLYKCFMDGKLTPFPQSGRTCTSTDGVKCTEDVEVYCHCRMPDMKNIPMIECSNCLTWFQTVCDCVKDEYLDVDRSELTWLCKNCTY